MQDGPVLSSLGEPCQENQWKEESRVAGSSTENFEDDIEAKAFAGEDALVHRHGEVMRKITVSSRYVVELKFLPGAKTEQPIGAVALEVFFQGDQLFEAMGLLMEQ